MTASTAPFPLPQYTPRPPGHAATTPDQIVQAEHPFMCWLDEHAVHTVLRWQYKSTGLSDGFEPYDVLLVAFDATGKECARSTSLYDLRDQLATIRKQAAASAPGLFIGQLGEVGGLEPPMYEQISLGLEDDVENWVSNHSRVHDDARLVPLAWFELADYDAAHELYMMFCEPSRMDATLGHLPEYQHLQRFVRETLIQSRIAVARLALVHHFKREPVDRIEEFRTRVVEIMARRAGERSADSKGAFADAVTDAPTAENEE